MYWYFGDIKVVVLYLYDLLVYAQTLEKYNQILERVIEQARSLNIKFNLNKLRFCLNEFKIYWISF